MKLFIISVLGLFCELMIIRWLATEVRIFAYFKNLPLMSAFFGLSLGFMWAHSKRDFFKWSGISFLYLALLLISALALGLTHLSFIESKADLMMLGDYWHANAIFTVVCMLGIFALTVFIFIGIGQKTGSYFQPLRTLEAYSINVFGALIGVLLFSLLSSFQTGPGIWLVVAGVLFMLLEKRLIYAVIVAFGILYAAWLGPFIAQKCFGDKYVTTVWSPYYRIDVCKAEVQEGPLKGTSMGLDIFINYDSFQSMIDCTPENLARLPENAQRQAVELNGNPYIAYLKATGKPPEEVLILGSGSGTDVAGALRFGAKHIDAVEIDPAIYNLGKQRHPEKPYSSDKVTIHLMDARTYINNCTKKYDVIAFALLDSHTAFSSLSSLRTDNYIFTKESVAQAAKLLNPEGGLLTEEFVSEPTWLWPRHCKALAEATATNPIGFWNENKLRPYALLLSGPGVKDKTADDFQLHWAKKDIDLVSNTDATTDDWPFLFLPHRELPSTYALPILFILIVASFPLINEFRKGNYTLSNWQMLALGAGFMLLEVRSMASLSLLFGSTWIVNSVTISAIMVFVLIANWLATKLNAGHIPILLGLALVAVLISTNFDVLTLTQMGPLLGGLLGVVIFLSPLIFASAVFSLFFKSVTNPSSALAFNLIGGLLGICLEYLSMFFGVRSLGYIGLFIYGLVLVLYFVGQKKKPA